MQTHLKNQLAVVLEFPMARARLRAQQRASEAVVEADHILFGNHEPLKLGPKARNYENLMRLAHLSLLQAEILAFKASEQLDSQCGANLG